MKLRSGRVLIPVVTKRKTDRKTMNDLKKIIESFKLQLKIASEDCQIIKEAKAFFRFLFYHSCKYHANKVRLEEIEKSLGRRPYLNEILNWKTDEAFWRENFQKAWIRMRSEFPSSKLLQAFYFFIKYEHPLQLEEPSVFARMKSQMEEYVEELYHQNNSARMVSMMYEQEQVKTRAFPIPDKKVYFIELADDLACQIVNPVVKQPHSYTISWNQLFEYSKARCCYVSEVDGGCTVVKLPYSNFSMFPNYHFKIIETKETFSSPEKDIRKALLLHKKCTDKNLSCKLQFIQGTNGSKNF